MPRYEISIPGMGRFEINSPTDLTEDQLDQSARELASQTNQASQSSPQPAGAGGGDLSSSSLSTRSPASAPPSHPATIGALPGLTDPGTQGRGYLQSVGERVNEAGSAFLRIPKSAVGVATGGETNSRFLEFLKLLQGAGAPFAVMTSPLEAGVETISKSLGASESTSRLLGDLGGAATPLGLGLLAKAGKLGPYGMQAAKVMGVGRAKDVTEQLRHDPQLRFALKKDIIGDLLPAADSPLEALARQPGVSMEQLALAAKAPKLAELGLYQKIDTFENWTKWARDGKIISEIPPEPRFTAKQFVEFVPPQKGDVTIFATLGTPTNVAARTNSKAGDAMYELAMAEINRKKSVATRMARNEQAILGVGDRDMRGAIRGLAIGKKPSDFPPGSSSRKWLDYVEKKVEVDRQILIPKIRNRYRSQVEDLVRNEIRSTLKEGDEIDPAFVGRMADSRIKEIVPDDMSIWTLMAYVMPGSHTVKSPLGSQVFKSKPEAQMAIRQMVKSGIDPKEIGASHKAFFDPEVLGAYSGRLGKVLDDVAQGIGLSKEEILAAAKGDFSSKTPNFFRRFDQGGPKGISKDVIKFMNIYDEAIERWSQTGAVASRVKPVISDLRERGYGRLADLVDHSLEALWGYRHPMSHWIDATFQRMPVINKLVAPMALERWGLLAKKATVEAFLNWNFRYHTLNSTQMAQTLWPIADLDDVLQGIKLRSSATGIQLLTRHQIRGQTKIGITGQKLGRAEAQNQEVAFLTMYNKARKLGIEDQRAAAYAQLRGNLYSQFLGLSIDQPKALRVLDPSGQIGMFQRFPIKQYEQVFDLIKDRNFPAVAKWLTTNLALGGMKSATMDTRGWVGHKIYNEIKKEYGEGMADMINVGLPSLIGIDLSNSTMLLNPPFGETYGEKLGNLIEGPLMSVTSSVIGAAANTAGPEPSAVKRAFNALVQRVPLFKELDAIVRLLEGNYELKDPIGRLRYKADFKDIVKRALGARTINETNLEGMATYTMEMKAEREQVLNYVASRQGQALLAGVNLGPQMEEMLKKKVDQWNNFWPEFPITQAAIMKRARARQQAATQSLRERILRGVPKASRSNELFTDPFGELENPTPADPNLPEIPFGGG